MVYPRGRDNLPRNEETFRQKIWPLLEQLRKKDKQRVTSDETL